MKKLLTLLFSIIATAAMAQLPYKIEADNILLKKRTTGKTFVTVDGDLTITGRTLLSSDTVNNKTGIFNVNGKLFIGKGTFVSEVSGGLDTVAADARFVRRTKFTTDSAAIYAAINNRLTESSANTLYARLSAANTFTNTNTFGGIDINNTGNDLLSRFVGTNQISQVRWIDNGSLIWSFGKLSTRDWSLLKNNSFLSPIFYISYDSENIGVGTATPQRGFHINKSVRFNKDLVPTTTGKFWYAVIDTTTGDFQRQYFDASIYPTSSSVSTALNLKADKATTLTIGNGTSAQDLSANRTFLPNVPNIDATQRSNHTGTQLAATISDFTTAARASISATSPLFYSSGVLSLDSNRWVGKNRNNDTIFGSKIYRDVQTILATTPLLRFVNNQDNSEAYFERNINDNTFTIYNSALQQSGSGNAIQLASNSGATATYTQQTNWSITGWFFGGTGSRDHILTIGNVGGNYFSLRKYGSTNLIWNSNNVGGEGYNIFGNVNTSTWFHYAVTFNGTSTRIFINGVQLVSANTGEIANPSTGFVYLGNSTGFYASTLRIDQMLVYNRALTQNGVSGDIDLIYNAGVGNAVVPTNGLIRRWEFETDFGTNTAVESSGVSGGPFNFTLNNTTWSTSGKAPVAGSAISSIGIRFKNAAGAGERMETQVGDPQGRFTAMGKAFNILLGGTTRILYGDATGFIIDPNGLITQPSTPNALSVVGSVSVGSSAIAAPSNGFRVSGNSIFSNITTNSTTTIAAQINLGASTATANTGQIFFPDGVNQTTVQNGLLNRVGGSLIWNVNGIAHITPRSLRTTATLDFPSIAAGATATLTVTLNNAVEADIADVSIPIVSQSAGLIWGKPRVAATNTIALDVFNPTGSAIDPPSGTFVFTVTKYL